MTVLIAHADADRAAAEDLAKFLERKGQFVELEDGVRGFRPAGPADLVVALWSKDTVLSLHRLALEKRTLEAWADERLALVRMDHAFAPVGLRDLPALDASFEPQRDIAWAAVARMASEARTRRAEQPGGPIGGPIGAPPPAAESAAPEPESELADRKREPPPSAPRPAPGPATRPAPSAAPAPARKRSGAVGALALAFGLLCLLVGGAGAYAWLVLSGGLPDAGGAVEALAGWIGDGGYQILLPGLGALAALLGAAAVALIAAGGPRRRGALPAPSEGATAPVGKPIFLSYAHADDARVAPFLQIVEAQGRQVWRDKSGIQAGQGWAGEIVRALREAGVVVVMCSERAFESDHVKREVYLADRYKKPLLPVFLEPAAMPEDYEYFFAGVQWLELYATPEADRPAAIAKAIGDR